MPFPQAPAGARQILGGWQRSGWLWCCERSCLWCSRRMTKRSSPAGSGLERSGTSERRVQSRSTPSEAKPGSFGTFRSAPSPVATPRIYHRPPDCTRGSPHSSAHPGTLWCWLSSRLRRCEVAWYDPHSKPYQNHNRSRKICFHHPGHVPVIRSIPDLHFEDAGNGPVVITWIGREHALYSGASPISLVEHCVTFRYDRRLQSLLGFVYNWPTSRWSATKKENRFSLNGNGIMSSFLGRLFYRSTLYNVCLRSLSLSSLGCKVLWIVISFLFLWFICWTSSLVHFKNSPEYLRRKTAKESITLMRFLLCSLVSRSFLVLLKYFFLNVFFHLHLLDGVHY